MTPSYLVPAEFAEVDVTALQNTLNALSDNGTKWIQIPVTGEYDILTESALLNAVKQLGKDAVLESLTGGV